MILVRGWGAGNIVAWALGSMHAGDSNLKSPEGLKFGLMDPLSGLFVSLQNS